MYSADPYSAPNANLEADGLIKETDISSPFSPRGRFGRLSYIAWIGGVNIVLGVLEEVIQITTLDLAGLSFPFPGVLFTVMSFIIGWIFMVRRLHDTDNSGWYSLIALIPVVNIAFILFLVFKSGTPGSNDFGPVRETPTWETTFAWIFIFLLVAAVVAVFAFPSFWTGIDL